MNSDTACECLRRLLCAVLQRTGFDATSPDALAELEDKVLLRGLAGTEFRNSWADPCRT